MAGIWGPLPYCRTCTLQGEGGTEAEPVPASRPERSAHMRRAPTPYPTPPPPDDAESLVFGVSMSVVTEKEVTPRRGAGEIR